MKLGPLQKLWIEQLRKHPERQMSGVLGEGNPHSYKACCLGELHLCAHRMKHERMPFGVEGGRIRDGDDTGSLEDSYEKYGLNCEVGGFLDYEGNDVQIRGFDSLAEMNDKGIPWPEIANIIEANPEKVFTKSV